jgi:hypothetical protein
MNIKQLLADANKRKICKMLGWSEQDYCDFQEEKGLEYLRTEICGDDWSVNCVAQSPMFWKWFINHWNARDLEFIINAWQYPKAWHLRKYKELNDMSGFVYRPHSSIMEATYPYMIEQVNREAVNV